jgi:hypothetical protein
MRRSTTWEVVGDGPETRINECRRSKDEQVVKYDDAKTEAVEFLESFVAPYLERIEQLKRDEFRERGALPKFKAWHRSHRSGELVVAKSQRHAAELLQINAYSFKCRYEQAFGDWWYQYATEESIWIADSDERGRCLGSFTRALLPDEAQSLLREEVAKYETMPLRQLMEVADSTVVIEREYADGLSVNLRIAIRRHEWSLPTIRIEGKIDEHVLASVRHYGDRHIPSENSDCSWQEVGF